METTDREQGSSLHSASPSLSSDSLSSALFLANQEPQATTFSLSPAHVCRCRSAARNRIRRRFAALSLHHGRALAERHGSSCWDVPSLLPNTAARREPFTWTRVKREERSAATGKSVLVRRSEEWWTRSLDRAAVDNGHVQAARRTPVMIDGELRPRGQLLDSNQVTVPMAAPSQDLGQAEDPRGNETEEEGNSMGNPSGDSGALSGQDPPPELAMDDEEQLLYPGLAPVVFFCVKQTTRPRSWCLRMVCNPYPCWCNVWPM
ncbi:hypothetical protein GN956_G2037 [Arapaima gigas]